LRHGAARRTDGDIDFSDAAGKGEEKIVFGRQL